MLLQKRIFYFLFLVSSYNLSFGQSEINVQYITPQFNNKNVTINKITQDALGNIWMTTNEGILKYNGYSYQFIKEKEVFSDITNNDKINYIYTDQLKNIWIKSKKGLLSKYDSSKGRFFNISSFFKEPIGAVKSKDNEVWIVTKTGSVYNFKNNKPSLITIIPNLNGIDNKIEGIEFVNKKELYISTTKGKIYNYSIKSKRLNELIGPYTDYPTFFFLQADNNNKLWIGTEAFGLLIYDISKKEFIQERFFNKRSEDVRKGLFTNLFLDRDGYMWGGTDGDGLYKINSKTGEVNVYRKESSNVFSLNSNTINDINADNKNNIWLVTKFGFINVIPKASKDVKYHKGSANNTPLRILSIYKSKDDSLWIGTDGNGLTLVTKDKTTKQFFNNSNNHFYVQTITEDDKGNIWFGTYKNGLWHYNRKKNKFKNISAISNKDKKPIDVRTVFKDSKGRIWVGTSIGINIYSSNKKLIASFRNYKNGLKGVILESIIEDKNQNIWLGMYSGGLFKFNENFDNIYNSTFTNFKTDLNVDISYTRSLSLGNTNEIWFINSLNKLSLFDIKHETFKNFDHLKPLKNSELSAVAVEDPYSLWISSTNGIHHFDRKKNIVKTFYTSDGFQSNNFMFRSKFIDKYGILYFGTDKGLNFFDPKKLNKEKSDAKLFVNDIQVLNKPAKSLLSDQILSDVFNIKELHLKNNQSSFSVKFSAIGNILNPNYYYSYKLEGFDKEWKTTFNEGLATYTNVPPGKYSLKIKANEINEDIFVAKKKIGIIIEYPFWNSSIANILYVILSVFLLYGILKWYSLRKKLFINKINRVKENDLHAIKMNFFAKMSHEIQTPITLILGSIDEMLKRAEINGNMLLKERLQIVSNSANRLSNIARQLTLVRNKELNKLKLFVTQNDLYNNITEISTSFKELARNKKIDFSINCPRNLSNAWYDKEKLEHILYNLLSNAFKYTPIDGNIQLSVTPIKRKSYIKIVVKDSGPGIKKEELNNIFEIFYRSENNKKAKGTGIGLALTKELIQLHRGVIKVKSAPNEGASFTIKLSILEENYKDFEKITSSKKSENLIIEKEVVVNEQKENFYNAKKTILIVEDNFELQFFLKKLLKDEYNILLAENGKEGFYHAKNNVPDLILSDIMMPEMNGIEMCKELNKHTFTKHIPIILLTAKNSTNSKIEGLETGAIEYINKPFNTNELKLKVKNVLISKEKIISKYRKELINKPEIKISKSQNEIFLEKLVSNVNERLKDPNFKVDELAEALHLSYSSLYRKCLDLTGMKLVGFISLLRLKKAAVLLTKHGYSISEVAYMVGFNDPKYFSKSFKSQFNIIPKEFKKQASLSVNIETFLKKYNIDIKDEIEFKE